MKNFTTQFSSREPIHRPIEILHKNVQGPNKSLREYISCFTRAALTMTDFNDQTGWSVFISNVHPTKQYKYLLGLQNKQSFTVMIEAAASHTLTEEHISPFAELALPIVHAPQPPRSQTKSSYSNNQSNRSDQTHQPNKASEYNHTPQRRENNRTDPYG